MNISLGLLRKVIRKILIENGLAVASSNLEPVQDGTFSVLHEKDRGVIDSTGLANSITTSEPQPSAFFRKTPGKFSGEMRKTIQALLSSGSTINYEYGFNKTHGIYTAADDTKYIIEVSSAGIFAILLPVAEAVKEDFDWLGYEPVYDPDFDALPKIELLNAAGMAEFYSKSSFFNACGWAFNSDGSQASNTCYNIAGAEVIYTAYLYTINITETDNIPSIANISLIESGWFNFNTYEGFKTPDPQEQFILPFFAHSEITNFDGEATLYVYYRNDQLVKMRSYHNQSVSENHNDGLPSGTDRCGIPFSYNPEDYHEYKNGSEYSDAHGGCYISPGFTADQHKASDHLSVHGYSYEKVDFYFVESNSTGSRFKNNSYSLECEYDYSVSASHSPIQFCIIPLGDRESIYYIEQSKNTTEDKLHTDAGTKGFDECEVYGSQTRASCDGRRARGPNTPPDNCEQFTLQNWSTYRGQVYDTDDGNLDCIDFIFEIPGTSEDFAKGCVYDNVAGIDTQLNFKIYLSSALESVPKLLYSDNTTTFDNEYFRGHEVNQSMAVYTDSVNATSFFSAEMDGNEGSKYDTIGTIDFNLYPIPTLSAGHLRFWVGEP